MAIDEVLLQTVDGPLLRFYRWNEPSVSFGYFGKFDEARTFAGGRVLVRRWTGGGIVPHGDDLTYSIVVPAHEAAYNLSSKAIYRGVNGVIARLFRASGIQTALAETSAPKITDSCFANPVVADVLEAGRKIAGAAQRKTRGGLLHQGSIQRGDLDQKFRDNFAAELSNNVSQEQTNADVLAKAGELASEKYSTTDWMRRR